MTQRSAWRRPIAAGLACWLAGSFTSFGLQAQTGAMLTGRVFASPSRTPLEGATVYAADQRTGRVYPAGPTAADGSFDLHGLPASTYDLAVGMASGLYVVPSAVHVESDRARQVEIVMNPASQPTAPAPPTTMKRPNVWNNPLTATLIVLGSAVVVGAIVDSATDDDPADEAPVSPSTPQR
jgi:hypothetical protein